MSPTERGLWDAVLADPADDFARLVYADYLEDHGRAPLARFVRGQIALAHCPPGHPGYADAVEAQSLAVAAARGASSLPAPTLPDGATFAGSVREVEGDNYGAYERGFASRVTFSGLRMRTAPGEVAKALDRVVARTPVREVDLIHLADSGLAELLASPAAARLTGLGVTQIPSGSAHAEQLLADCPHLGGVRRLALGYASDRYALVAAQNSHDWAELSRAPWLAGVTHGDFYDWMLAPLGERLGPTLTSLTVRICGRTAGMLVDGLRHCEFGALTQLSLPAASFDRAHARDLARVTLPPLAALHLSSPLAPQDALAELLAAPYLGGLTELAIRNPRAVPFTPGLLSGPALRTLRLLHFDCTLWDGDALAELARPGLFPALTTLSLRRSNAPRDGSLAAFAEAWRGERLHTLVLDGWPAPAAALQRLAANPAFKSLRRLKLARCGVSDAGGLALARSPHLQNLVELDLCFNTLGKKSAALFLDPSVMPNLALADLTTNKMHPDTRTRLRASRVGVWA